MGWFYNNQVVAYCKEYNIHPQEVVDVGNSDFVVDREVGQDNDNMGFEEDIHNGHIEELFSYQHTCVLDDYSCCSNLLSHEYNVIVHIIQ